MNETLITDLYMQDPERNIDKVYILTLEPCITVPRWTVRAMYGQRGTTLQHAYGIEFPTYDKAYAQYRELIISAIDKGYRANTHTGNGPPPPTPVVSFTDAFGVDWNPPSVPSPPSWPSPGSALNGIHPKMTKAEMDSIMNLSEIIDLISAAKLGGLPYGDMLWRKPKGAKKQAAKPAPIEVKPKRKFRFD